MIRLAKIRSHAPFISSVLYVILFVYAATSKTLEFSQFKIQLGQSPILTAHADWIAWVIPSLEYVLAIFLLWERYRLKALYASLGLMTMFTTYILLILNFSDFIPCSCGGVLENLGWTEHIVFNSFFMVLALISILELEGLHNLNQHRHGKI